MITLSEEDCASIKKSLNGSCVLTPMPRDDKGIWNVYIGERPLTGQKYVFKRMDFKNTANGEGEALFEHRVNLLRDLKRLPAWLLEYHVTLPADIWRHAQHGCVLEPYVEGFRFTDDAFARLVRANPTEAQRLLRHTAWLFKLLYTLGAVHGDAHLGNVLLVRNDAKKLDGPIKFGLFRPVLIDLDWCHTINAKFSDKLLQVLRNMCADLPDMEFPKDPCSPDSSLHSVFCQYRSAALLHSGGKDTTVAPYVDLSVFAYNLYVHFVCDNEEVDIPDTFREYVAKFYTVAHDVDFDVTKFIRN